MTKKRLSIDDWIDYLEAQLKDAADYQRIPLPEQVIELTGEQVAELLECLNEATDLMD